LEDEDAHLTGNSSDEKSLASSNQELIGAEKAMISYPAETSDKGRADGAAKLR